MAGSSNATRLEAWHVLSRNYIHTNSKIRINLRSKYKFNINDIYSPLTIIENPLPNMRVTLPNNPTYANSILDRECDQIFPLEDVILRKQSQLYLAIGQIGTGKTWLARNIASIWANDLVNEGKTLLIYVDCELPEVKSAKHILTIVTSLSSKDNYSFINYFERLLTTDGRDIIFIIDAYDVLLRYVPNNPLHQIVGRKLLSKSSILLLSRPCVQFYNELKTTYESYTQLEVLGFSSKNCMGYFTKSSTKLLQGSQLISTFLSMFPDLRHLARFPLLAFSIIKLLSIEDLEHSLSVDYIMKYILVQIINQQVSHYLTGDIKSHQLNILSLNIVTTWKYQSLCHLYKNAYESLLNSVHTVTEDLPTFHERFSPDGLGLYCTTYTLINNEWKPQYTFISLIVQEFLASMHTKKDHKKKSDESFDLILPFLQRDIPPHYFILACSKNMLMNESDIDVFRFYLPTIHTSIRAYALVLNILVEIMFVPPEKLLTIFPDNTIQLSDYPMEGWLLRGLLFFLKKFSVFTSLSLTNCSITDKILYLLLTNLNLNSAIQYINLQSNKLTDSSVPIIRNSFQQHLSYLRKIDLSNNSISITQIISLESDFPQIEFISNQTIPQEILNRGEDFVSQYQLACNEGSQHIRFFRLMVVGSEGVGKTSLLKALRNKPFEGKEMSTDFIEKTDISITELSNDWSQNLSFKDRLKETRDDILAHITVKRVKSLTNLSNLTDDTNFIELGLQSDSTDNEVVSEPEPETNEITPTNEPLLEDKQTLEIAQPPIEQQLEEPINTPPIEYEQLSLLATIPTIHVDQEPSDNESTDNTADPPTPASFAQLANLPLKSIQDHWSNQRALLPIEFFTVWDLAGQSYFFCMHSLFLTPRAVYILPVDLSVKLQEPVVQRERETGRLDRREIKGKVTHLDIIQYWIMTIYSVAKSTAAEVYECKSRVIVVFTKADLVDNPIEKAAGNFQLITNSLSRKSNCLSIVDKNYHIVSAKDRSIQGFGNLRESIHLNADEIGFNHALPVRWLDFVLNILSSTNPVLGKAEITKIAENTRCSQDYTEILQLFHSIGVFFFRKNILVKSLQSLLDIIFHVVSPMNCLNLIQSMPKIAKSKSKQSFFRQDIEKAQSMAILTDNILNAILERNSLTEVKAEITQLLEEFGVLLFKCGHGKHTEHFIPYLFKEDISTIYQPDPTDQIIYLYFPDYQIPTSFYFALLSLCLNRCSEYSHHKCKSVDKNDPKLAFDCVKFEWETNLSCILDFTEHQPYIRVIFQDIEYSDLNIRSKMFSLLFTLQKWIIQIQRDLILSGKLAKIVLNCPCNSFSRTLKPCVYFETFLKQSGNESHFYCKAKQTYFAWRFFNKLLPFKQIPQEFGVSFIDKHREHIVQNLNLNLMLEALFEEGLINGEELSQIYFLERKERVETVLNNLPNKGKDWADKFYKLLNSKSAENRDIRSLFKSYIVQTLFAEIPVGEDLDFGRYPILNNPCGICLIIHNENFDDNSKRRGSHIDFLNLKQTFENMNFLIYSYEDLSKFEMRKYITEIRSMDHSAFDTFFCIVMSHGDEEECILTRDMKTIKKETILNSFTADACPSLAGKPKVFIFQACRGHRQDQGLDMLVDTKPDTPIQDDLSIQPDHMSEIPSSSAEQFVDAPPPIRPRQEVKKVANFADFYIAQATVKGYVSYRFVSKGSVFISALCSVLKSARYHHHLVDMMIEVRRQVSMVDVKNNVQCPEATDTFTKQLYLF